ncbi:MAG: tRNA lysidine(34) synthetase [Candidatus Heteroscillospira sp.]|jgi:tRNA 2-thiocytidine biosynthesis protein TtcA
MKAMNEFSGFVRRCVDDFDMIQPGDRIAVGVSGGKDSLVLLCALKYLQGYYPRPFHLEGITLDLGFEGMDFTPVKELCRRWEIPYTVIQTDIKEIVFDVRKEENPCSLCSKMRRGGLNNAMKEHGCNKLALGHHYDDAVETFMMSLFYEGRISCFKPKTWMSRAGVWQIRPMMYADEQRIARLAERYRLPIVENPCPQDKSSKRHEVKELIASLSERYPDLKSKVFGSMQRLPLEGWEK